MLRPTVGPGLLAALRGHGPLEYCARIDPADYPYPELWARVSQELTERHFALLDAAVGKWLMELDCPVGDSEKLATQSG